MFGFDNIIFYDNDNNENYCEFSHQRQLVILHRNLSDSKSSMVSKTLLSILAARITMPQSGWFQFFF